MKPAPTTAPPIGDIVQYDWSPETGWARFVYRLSDGRHVEHFEPQRKHWTPPDQRRQAGDAHDR